MLEEEEKKEEEKTEPGPKQQPLNTTHQYYVSLVTFQVNPYAATPEYLNMSGSYLLDRTFPVYKPVIEDAETQELIVNPEGFSIHFDFVVPPLTKINEYTCGQRVSNWSNLTCTRTAEILEEDQVAKIWCQCPYVSDTTLVRVYEQFVEQDVDEYHEPEFGNGTFFDFPFGLTIFGVTILFLLMMVVGMVLDNKKVHELKELKEENERKLEEIRTHVRRNYKSKNNADNVIIEEEEEEKINQVDDNDNVIPFDQMADKKEAETQTEQLVITSHRDMEIKDLTLGLLCCGIFKLQEFIAILIFYDSQMVRPVRFLAIYIKLMVMLSLSGILFDQKNLLVSVGITLFFAEFSTIFLKIVKAQLGGKGPQIIIGGIISVALLTLAFVDIFLRAYGQTMLPLNEWLMFYGFCMGINIFVFDPLIVIFKVRTIM